MVYHIYSSKFNHFFYRFILQPHDNIKKNLTNKKKAAEEKIKNLEVCVK